MTASRHRRSQNPSSSGCTPDGAGTLELVAQVRQLQAALEISEQENDQLRRRLARAQAENRHLQGAVAPRPAHSDPRSHVRTMLRDAGSRNP